MSNDVSIDDVVTGPKPSAPHIVSVVPSSGHRLLLEYETGEKKLFDVTPYIKGDFFRKAGRRKLLPAGSYSVRWLVRGVARGSGHGAR